jgi:hypothetical protein
LVQDPSFTLGQTSFNHYPTPQNQSYFHLNLGVNPDINKSYTNPTNFHSSDLPITKPSQQLDFTFQSSNAPFFSMDKPSYEPTHGGALYSQGLSDNFLMGSGNMEGRQLENLTELKQPTDIYKYF